MGMLVRNDARLQRRFFKEMAKLVGYRVQYQYPVHSSPTIHAEIQCEFSEEIPMDIIFETNPKMATLKAIGWISEYKDDKPYVAMLPMDAPELQTKCRIKIPPIDIFENKSRTFEITSITTVMEYPDCYICTVAPVVNNDDQISQAKADYTDLNYTHLESEMASADAYDNGYEKKKVIEQAENTYVKQPTVEEKQQDELSYFRW